jgi:hypothetical protein
MGINWDSIVILDKLLLETQRRIVSRNTVYKFVVSLLLLNLLVYEFRFPFIAFSTYALILRTQTDCQFLWREHYCLIQLSVAAIGCYSNSNGGEKEIFV